MFENLVVSRVSTLNFCFDLYIFHRETRPVVDLVVRMKVQSDSQSCNWFSLLDFKPNQKRDRDFETPKSL